MKYTVNFRFHYALYRLSYVKTKFVLVRKNIKFCYNTHFKRLFDWPTIPNRWLVTFHILKTKQRSTFTQHLMLDARIILFFPVTVIWLIKWQEVRFLNFLPGWSMRQLIVADVTYVWRQPYVPVRQVGLVTPDGYWFIYSGSLQAGSCWFIYSKDQSADCSASLKLPERCLIALLNDMRHCFVSCSGQSSLLNSNLWVFLITYESLHAN